MAGRQGSGGLTRWRCSICAAVQRQNSSKVPAAGKVTRTKLRKFRIDRNQSGAEAHPCAGLVLAGGSITTKSRAIRVEGYNRHLRPLESGRQGVTAGQSAGTREEGFP